MNDQISEQLRTISSVIRTLEEMSARLVQSSLSDLAIEVPLPPALAEAGRPDGPCNVIPFRRSAAR
ncbi:MAG: hypothetical protein M3T49_11260 [Candidatus Eremiobacteraeota bacterium]|nr:hypothetical protein [Candidatus Eremiobacteraeota bacterium]